MERRPKIAIIGSGIAGLAAALALYRRGIEVAVLRAGRRALRNRRRTEGCVTLPGDSAHAMLPFLAQGAAVGIEDGVVLAEWAARLPDDIDEALRRYEAMRVPRTRRAVLGARERAKLNHLPSRWARFKRDIEYAARRVLYPDGTARRVAWLYSYDVLAEEHHRTPQPIAA